MGSSCSPLLGIWKKWSMTEREAKPASSADVAMSRSFGARVDASASHFQRLRCSPSFTCASVLVLGGLSLGVGPLPLDRVCFGLDLLHDRVEGVGRVAENAAG